MFYGQTRASEKVNRKKSRGNRWNRTGSSKSGFTLLDFVGSNNYGNATAKRFGQTDDTTVVSLYLASKAAQASSEEMAYSK